MEPGTRLSKRDCPETPDPQLHKIYRGIVGHLSFLVMMTRPDLAFAFAELSKFVQAPGEVHMRAAKHMLAYLAGTKDDGITYSKPTNKEDLNVLMGWVDSDFAADTDTRWLVSGYLISMNNGPISWKAKRQLCTTLSSAEAEFVAASVCGVEVIYLRNLLSDLGYEQTTPTTVFEDNAACILMSENPAHPDHSRHIDTRKWFLRDMVRDQMLKLVKCAGTQNVADAFTKSLPGPSFTKHREYMWGSRKPFEAFFCSVGAMAPSKERASWLSFNAAVSGG